MKTNPVRVATVLATGARYIVQQLSFGPIPKCHCWGEVVSFRGGSTVHEPAPKAFLLSEVSVKEIDKTETLLRELIAQTVASRRAEGHVVERRGRHYQDLGTPEQMAVDRASQREFARSVERVVEAIRALR